MSYRVSLGARSFDAVLRPRSSLGASFNLSAAASADLKKLETQANATIGGAADAYASATAKLDSAMATGQGVAAAAASLDMTGRDIADAIVNVAASPATHLVLAAAAAAAPPFSTAAAAVAEAAIGIAVVAVHVVKALEDTWNDTVGVVWTDIFGSSAEKTAKAWNDLEAKSGTGKVWTVAEVQAILDGQAGREQRKKDFAANREAATKELAALRIAAGNGDKKAIAALAIVDTLMQDDMLLLTTILRAGCSGPVWDDKAKTKSGLTVLNVCDVARAAVQDQLEASKLSQKDFDFLWELSCGKRYRKDLVRPNQNEPSFLRITDTTTGQVIAERQAAIDLNQKTFLCYAMDPVTRRVRLDAQLKMDIQELFKGTLLKSWQEVDAKATQDAVNALKIQQTLAAQLDRSGLVTTTYSTKKSTPNLYSSTVKTSATSLYSTKASMAPSGNKALVVGGLLVLAAGVVVWKRMQK